LRYLSIFLAVCLYVTNVNAAQYIKEGTIHRLGAIDSRQDADFVILNGFTEAGSCPLSGGLVVGRFHSGDNGSRSFAIALAAKMAGKSITLVVNDSDKNSNGSCYVHSVAISE